MDRRMVETLSKCLRNVKNGCVSTAPSKPEEVVAAAPNDSSSIIIDENTNKEQVVVTDSGNNTKTITNVDAAHKTVVVIAATSRLDAIESRIRGLFAADIGIPIPSETARTAILRRITINARLSASVDFDLLGKKSPGYVGADLENLCEEAVRQACLRRQQQQSSSTALTESTTVTEMNVVGENSTLEAVDGLKLEQQDFLLALKQIVPTAKKEGFAMPPNVTWKDVGALQETRNQIMKHVLGPMLHREEYSKLGLTASAGVMFFGPPGCGKTLLAKVLANSSRANFISVKGPELLNQYVGQSEAQVRQVFERASQTKPCVIFFDEIDALVPRRSSGSDGSGNRVTDRVVNQLLTELDGVTAREDVYVIGATNRLDTLDPAILRPGRLGTLLYVPLPDERDRVSILRALLRTRAVRWKFGPKSTSDSNQVVIDENGVDVHYVAKNTDGFSGADLKALVDSAAGVIAEEFLLAESLKNDPELQELLYSNIEEDDAPTSSIVPQFSTGENDTKEICMKLCGRHFVKALQEVRPSVAEDERRRFARIDAKIRAGIPAVEAIQQVTKEEENE
jgi:SpoVK/Ycf46/Vps4 family AAA+-type ATPase